MRYAKLQDMKGGWFVGDFDPSTYKTNMAEVGFKSYRSGESNPMHYHKCGTEVTLITSGQCQMSTKILAAGDIIVLEPYEASDFYAITDCDVIVFKSVSIPGDKYPGVPDIQL